MFLLGGRGAVLTITYGLGSPTAQVWKRPGWDVARLACSGCGYDLRGTGKVTTCSECGKTIDPVRGK